MVTLAESRLTAEERARLKRIEIELKLVGCRTYVVNYRRRGGRVMTFVGRFVKVGRNHSGDIPDGLIFVTDQQPGVRFVFERSSVESIEEVVE